MSSLRSMGRMEVNSVSPFYLLRPCIRPIGDRMRRNSVLGLFMLQSCFSQAALQRRGLGATCGASPGERSPPKWTILPGKEANFKGLGRKEMEQNSPELPKEGQKVIHDTILTFGDLP